MADDQKPQQETITVPVQKLVQMVAQMFSGGGKGLLPPNSQSYFQGGEGTRYGQYDTSQNPMQISGAATSAAPGTAPGQKPQQPNTQPGNLVGTPQGLAPPPFNQQAPGSGKTNPQLTGPYALPPQGGGGPPQGSQSAPPAGGGGQPVGAPQLPQGGGGLQQAPFSGTGHPAMASPVQDYGSFLKAYPMPKAPTYEDAIGVAEELRQGQGMRGPGQGDPLGTNPALVDLVMKGMNEQYREQMGHHSAAYTGQLQAAHLHNSGLAQQERERHDRAAEKNTADAISGRGTDKAADRGLKRDIADQRHSEFTDKLSVLREKADTALEAVHNAADAKARDNAMKQYQEAQKTLRSFEADYINLQNGPNAGTPEGKAEGERLRSKADQAGQAKPPAGGDSSCGSLGGERQPVHG